MTAFDEMTSLEINEAIAGIKGFEIRKAPDIIGNLNCWYCVPEDRWYPTGHPDWSSNYDDASELLEEMIDDGYKFSVCIWTRNDIKRFPKYICHAWLRWKEKNE